MSKSAIYTANTTAQNVAVNGSINPGTVIRRFGCNVHMSGSSINLTGTGYYDVDASFTLAPTAAGNVTVTMLKDGVPVPGATATAATSTANNPVNLSISCLVREYCPCADDSSNLTFVLSGTASSITNVSLVIEKL